MSSSGLVSVIQIVGIIATIICKYIHFCRQTDKHISSPEDLDPFLQHVASICSYTPQLYQCFPQTQQSLRYCYFTSIVILLGLRSLNTKPKFRAADTSAASSGDCAWYSSLPEGKRNFNLLYFFSNTHIVYNIQPVINTGRKS